MLPIVKDRVAWPVGLSLSEPCKTGWSDGDAVCVKDSGGPKEPLLDIPERFQPNTVLWAFHTIQPYSYRLKEPILHYVVEVDVFFGYISLQDPNPERVWMKPEYTW